ncbi:MAG: hypothetical protein LBT99_03510, partial [Bifidobacteriaceae bacterium]|nr:hypothetical protein [Bifidobacteriaceae bacterium]
MLYDTELKVSYIDLDFAIQKINALKFVCQDSVNINKSVLSNSTMALSQWQSPYSYNLVYDSIANNNYELNNLVNELSVLVNKINLAIEKYQTQEKAMSLIMSKALNGLPLNFLGCVLISAVGTAEAIINNIGEMLFDKEGLQAWDNFTYDMSQKIIDLGHKVPLNIELLSQSLSLIIKAGGFIDESVLSLVSKHTLLQLENQTANYDKSIPADIVPLYKKPANLTELAYKVGSMQSYTFDGTTNFQIMVKSGNPPSFTIILPPTTGWYEVNGWPENFNIMSGNSNLVQLAKTAL